jgi:RNA polymerase sigma-70 factor (ECF subfamily)
MVYTLPEKYAKALILVEFSSLSYKEASQKLGISVSGVKSRVQRARKMIKDSLMRCCHFVFDRFGTILDYHPVTCCCCREDSKE